MVLVLAVPAAAAAGCGSQPAEESPQAGFRAWVAAAQSGDAKGVWDRLSDRSRAEALAVAGLAADTPEPWRKALFAERLDVNWDNLDAKVAPGATATRAELDLTGVDATSGKRSAKVTMVLELGTWRVDLPTPPGVPPAAVAPAPATAPATAAAAPPATAAAATAATATATAPAPATAATGAATAAATAAP